MLFDIAISGPLAGLVIALPVAYLGVLQVTQISVPNVGDPIYGDPLLLRWMIEMVHGPLAPGEEVGLNPLLFAGWVGIFITALNLVPIGQLDGGHMLYTLIGRRSHLVARLLLVGAVAFMVYTRDPSYGLILLLLFLFGPLHPPTANDRVPLGWPRHVLGWLTLSFILIGFTPHPISSFSPVEKSQESKPESQKPDKAVLQRDRAPSVLESRESGSSQPARP
jgi:membrane-associated protease RseP (regulator of RpoE activity)